MLVKLSPIVLGAAALGIAACGGSTTSSGAGGTPTPTASVDSCLVGTWTSTGASGSSNATGTVIMATGGGAGEVLTINADGTLTADDTNMTPITLTAGGQTYTDKLSGTAMGTITASNGSLSYTRGSGSTSTSQVFGPDGAPAGTPAPDKDFTATYSCTAGQSLTVTQSGGSVLTYASGTGGAASSTSSSTETSSSSS